MAPSLEEALSSTYTTRTTAVPFFDGTPMMEGLKAALLAEISDLIDSGRFANGPQVTKFEAAFAAYTGTKQCVGTASGLDALRLALIAAGLEPGEEVIVPAQTFIATLEAVTQAGGVPVVAEISESDYNIDPEAVDPALTPRTRFVMPVHLYGQMADLQELQRLALWRGFELVEDACQAHGAQRDGLRPGCTRAAAFSFYPAKNLGAMGDAGALVTNDATLAVRIRALREHGQTRKYHHAHEGYTARLDTLQAIVLLEKLPLLDYWNDDRTEAARFYSAALTEVGDLRLPPVPEGSDPVWHLYVVRTAKPQELADFLRVRGIDTGRHYPEPPHLAPAFAHLGYRPGAFPVAEALAREALSLPMFPGITELQLSAVVEAVSAFFAGK
jgi:dTDP-3-amino-3,4,6-trideoxy-alpha-D-glucose transaminase